MQLARFSAGADDVIPPDISPRLLGARLDVQLRHARRAAVLNHEVLAIGALRLDTTSLQVEVHGRPVELTAPLFAVLRILVHNAGAVVTTAILARALGRDAGSAQDHRNAVRVAINRLRARIGTDEGVPHVVTARSVGYRLMPP